MNNNEVKYEVANVGECMSTHDTFIAKTDIGAKRIARRMSFGAIINCINKKEEN